EGQRLASASWDNTVKMWDARTELETRTVNGHTGSLDGVAFSPDGQRLASASGDKTVKVWDARTGQETLTLKGHTSWVHAVAFSRSAERRAGNEWKERDAGSDREKRAPIPNKRGLTSVP